MSGTGHLSRPLTGQYTEADNFQYKLCIDLKGSNNLISLSGTDNSGRKEHKTCFSTAMAGMGPGGKNQLLKGVFNVGRLKQRPNKNFTG